MRIMNKLQTRSLLLLLCFSLAFPAGAQPTGALPTVDPGSQADAEAYYKRLSTDLKFLAPDRILTSNLDDLLQYFGYKGLRASDLEKLPSDVLMDFAKLKAAVSNPAEFTVRFPTAQSLTNAILVSRFFAPKITDDSHPAPHGLASSRAENPSRRGCGH